MNKELTIEDNKLYFKGIPIVYVPELDSGQLEIRVSADMHVFLQEIIQGD